MKSTLKIIMLCLVTLFSISLLSAQTEQKRKPSHSEVHSEKKLIKMTKDLSLTEEQVAKITAINAVYTAEMKKLKADSINEDGPSKSIVKAFKALRETAINLILTTEQLEIHEKIAAKKHKAVDKVKKLEKKKS